LPSSSLIVSISLMEVHMKIEWLVLGMVAVLAMPTATNAQGVVSGTQQGASQGAREGSKAGNKAAGPVGGAVGGVVGGAVGGVTGGVKGAVGAGGKPKGKKTPTTN
jgi:hypothetical protein